MPLPDQFTQDYQGEYVSLAGFKGKQGLIARGQSNLIVPDSGTNLLLQNGSRVFATIRNSSDQPLGENSDVTVALSDVSGTATLSIMRMKPGDVLTIDFYHPWSGPVSAWADLGKPSKVDIIEVSIR